jgi:hypothetical protein
MAKVKPKIDNRQGSIYELLRQLQAPVAPVGDDEGSLNLAGPLGRAMNTAIRECSLSRWEIAGAMSHLLGREISKAMLDSWTAESKDGHRPPADVITALCVVTKCKEPLLVLSEPVGLFIVPGPDALRAEIQKLDEEAKKIAALKRMRQVFLKEMEK